MSSFVSDNRSIVYGQSMRERFHEYLTHTPWWAISVVIHAVVLIFAYYYTWEIPIPRDEVELQSDIYEPPKMPQVVLPQETEQKTESEQVDNRRRVENRPDVNQSNLPDFKLKTPGDPDQNLRVLAVPGGTIQVGAIGGGGFEVAGDAGGAMGALTGWGGWRKRCLAIWLFDESKSMKDDQQLVRQRVDQLYADLGINVQSGSDSQRILTVVCSYGKDAHVLLAKPTNDMAQIKEAIDKIPVDDTGKENYIAAINNVLNKYDDWAKKYARNIVVILVTDEAGDDDEETEKGGSPIEATLARMKRMKASLLVFGAEGGAFNYAAEQTYDPTVPQGYSPYAYVHRGIDTAFGEMVPHDWYFRRVERVPSGFGPYGPSRLALETGGVFYLMRAAKANAYDYEKLLSGYQPELESQVEVARRNSRNHLRKTVMSIIIRWNQIRGEAGSSNFSSYFHSNESGKTRMERTLKTVDEWIALMNDAIKEMERLGNVQVKDSPKRWEANRELMWAEIHKLRFQLVQYRFALVDLMNGRNIPPPGDIGWHISWYRNPIIRGEQARLDEEKARIQKMFQEVIDHHKGTPWEVFAAREMRSMSGFAVHPWSSSRSSGVKHEAR